MGKNSIARAVVHMRLIKMIRSAPIPAGNCISIELIPLFLMVSESVWYIMQVPILLFMHY